MTADPARPAAYASLAELRAAQARLGELRRKGSETAALWDAAAEFVRRGAATGVVIDGDDERWSVQGLLDYWASALERAGRPRGDSSLAEFDPEQAPELPDDACPYLGLSAFDEARGHLFFGRDAVVAKLVQQLAEHRLVALVGPSGSGKSSLAFAGLMRGLRQGALPGSEAWRILPPMVPGDAPRAALASRLAAGRDGDAAVVLVVDQFEELFTMCESEDERAGFVADLVALVGAPSPPHRVVLTVRSDFESFVARHPALYERYAAGRVAVTPPSAAELRQAIEAPAALVGLKFEAGVIDRLLQELLGEPAGLPLLQFTLLRLWEERHRNRVTAAAYGRVGGGRQALARTADAVYDAMLPEDQATARRIFLMVGLAVDDRHEATRTRVARAQIFDHGDDPGRVERVLDRLLSARLLRQTAGPGEPEPRVEVAHEALVRNWPRLAEWLQEAQTSLGERRRLEAKARDWVRLGRGKSALMDEVELREAERWLDGAAGLGLRPSADLVALIARSRERVAALARRQRFVIYRLIVVTAALAVMLVICVAEYRKAQRALDSDRARALENLHLICAAAMEQGRSLLLDGHVRPMRALPYLVESRDLALQATALDARPVDSTALRMLFAQAARGTPLVTLIGHTDAVNQAAFSADGARVVTASDDRTARVWDAATGQPVTPPLVHAAAVVSAAFSPDGARLVTATSDGTAQLWDAATGQPVTSRPIHVGPVVAVAFSPDSARVVLATKDGAVQVLDARTAGPVAALRAQAGVTAVRFSPDGAQVIAVGEREAQTWDARTGQPVAGHGAAARVIRIEGDAVRIWNTATGQPVTPPLVHQADVRSAVFSADGARVVTASEDRTARVWNAATGVPVGEALEHDGHVVSAVFSADGMRVVTASDDDTARVWDARTGRAVTEPLDVAGRIRSAAFSPDGARVVTAGDDSAVRIWEARSGVLVTVELQDDRPAAAPRRDAGDAAALRARWLAAGERPMILLDGEIAPSARTAPAARRGARAGDPLAQPASLAFSPDGTRVVMATVSDAARVWDARTGQPVTAPLPHQGMVLAAAFRPDGARVVTASLDGTARVWDARTGQPVTAPLSHQGPVIAVAFSPDGMRVVTASADGTARVWDAATGRPMTPRLHYHGRVRAAAFSPDRMWGIIATDDGTARVWDCATGDAVTPPLGHRAPVLAATFSPDGTRVVTASDDHTAQIWDATTGQPATPALEHRGPVSAVAFSPDGARVVTASRDSTARIWDARTGRPLVGALEHQGAVLTAAFSADGTRVVTASADGRVRVWDAATGKPLTASLEHRGRVFAAVFSPDGTRVATGSGLFRGRIWELPIDDGSPDDWRQIARCSPFALVAGVFTANPDPRAVCPHRAPSAADPPGSR